VDRIYTLAALKQPPEIACIVVSYRSQRDMVAAVRSILVQDVPVEVVVVNSGGGEPAAALAAAGIDVPVIDHPERLFFGGAANLGIAATTAPLVSLLAADCVAEAGWLAARIERHGSGAPVVAAAVTNAYPKNVFSWAAHVLLWSTRMPGVAPAQVLLYGLSFKREVLDAIGGFRSNLRAGEDTDIKERLSGRYQPVWEPRVRTAHRNPRGLFSLLADQYRRGARSVRTWRDLGQLQVSRTVPRNALRRFPSLIRVAWAAALPGERRWIALATPLVPLGAFAYALGAAIGRGKA